MIGDLIMTVEELDALPAGSVVARFYPGPNVATTAYVKRDGYRPGWEATGDDEGPYSADTLASIHREGLTLIYRPDRPTLSDAALIEEAARRGLTVHDAEIKTVTNAGGAARPRANEALPPAPLRDRMEDGMSDDEYTPTTAEVRARNGLLSDPFDRWLAAHDAEVARAARVLPSVEGREALALGLCDEGLVRSEWLARQVDYILDDPILADAPSREQVEREAAEKAWDEGAKAGHACVGAGLGDDCLTGNPYRADRLAEGSL